MHRGRSLDSRSLGQAAAVIADVGARMMMINSTKMATGRRVIIACDLAMLGFGVALLFTSHYAGLGCFFCAAAAGLLILMTVPRLFKFYVLAWLLVFVIIVVLVEIGYYHRYRMELPSPIHTKAN
jgi:hypothetical protein